MTKAQSSSDYATINTSYTFTSWMGVLLNYAGGVVNATGYPATAGGYQTTQVGTISADPVSSVLDYETLSTSDGNSGGPLWLDFNGSDDVAGVVSTGSWACQLTAADWSQIESWVSEDGYNLGTTAEPVVAAVPVVSLAPDQSISASSLIASVSNPNGDDIAEDIYEDLGGGSGYFAVNGVRQPDGVWIYATPLENVQYVGGSSPGSDTLGVGVADATTNSNFSTSLVATTIHVAPVVTAVASVSLVEGQSISASSLIASISNPSGDDILEDIYEDLGGGSGYFTVDGLKYFDGIPIDALPGEDIQYVGGSSPGSDALSVGIYDLTTDTYIFASTSVIATTTSATNLTPTVFNNFSWAQGWGSANNPREVVETATNPSGDADYVGFGTSSVIMAFGESTVNGPTFTNAIAAVHDFGSAEGYTAAVQRGAADTGDSIAPTVYGQGFKGVYWYDATGGTGTDPTYQSTPNLYPDFGSQQGWTPANGFDVVKADSSDAYASILGFGNAGIVVGPQAFDPSTSGSPPASYLIPFAAGNNSGWSQTTDIRSFVDSNGQAIDLNGDGVTDFVGMGPQGLEFAFGSDTGGQYSLGALQLAQINGTNSDFGDAQGWNDSNTTRDIVKDPTTGYYDIIAFGAAGVYVSMGQDPSTHGGQPFGQSYLALDNFGLNQGWSNTLTPRLVGDVNGDGIPDIVGFGASNTFTAFGSHNGNGDLIFTMEPTATIANYGYNEGWSTSNTVRTLADVDGSGRDSLVLSGANGTQTLKFG